MSIGIFPAEIYVMIFKSYVEGDIAVLRRKHINEVREACYSYDGRPSMPYSASQLTKEASRLACVVCITSIDR